MNRENERQLLATWLQGECKEDLRYFEPRDFKDGHNSEIFRILKADKENKESKGTKGTLKAKQAYSEEVIALIGYRFPSLYENCFREAVKELPLRYAKTGDTPEQIRKKTEEIDARLAGSRPMAEEKANGTLELMRAKIEAGTGPTIISTGFPHLDEKIDGGLRAGLYVIGAVSSLGKTSFCIQLADNIAKAGKPVLFVSLEMAREELVAKILSRLTYERSQARTHTNKDAKTTIKILNTHEHRNYTETEREILNEAIEELEARGDKLIIYEGLGNVTVEKIKAKAKQAEKMYGTAPVVIVDYLQIIAPEESYRGTDKQAIDKNVLELKRLSRDLNTPVLAISSFNRENYYAPVSLASFKESGAIEYGSDVLLALQLLGMDYQEGEGTGKGTSKADIERRARIKRLIESAEWNAKNGKVQDLELKVLKNRNGARGALSLNFVAWFNYFSDVGTIEGASLDGWEDAEDDIEF